MGVGGTGLGGTVRALRLAQGLTQAELARAAGVSRQLVGAVEADRHLPRVDAAAALARVLGSTVEALLADAEPATPLGVVEDPVEGGLVRVARVGDRLVAVPVAPSGSGLPMADGVVRGGRAELFEPERPTAVVAGCEPAIGLTARLLEARSATGAIAVSTSSARAFEALAAGRVHAAVLHGVDGALPDPPCPVRRVRLVSWQVGLAAPVDAAASWVEAALAGRVAVAQREAGAQTQAAFERAVAATNGARPPVPGPVVASHAAAARLAADQGLPAVTIEPSARLLGLAFHPLEVHTSELWVATEHARAPEVERFADLLTTRPVTSRLAAVGGYDLSGLGTPVAA